MHLQGGDCHGLEVYVKALVVSSQTFGRYNFQNSEPSSRQTSLDCLKDQQHARLTETRAIQTQPTGKWAPPVRNREHPFNPGGDYHVTHQPPLLA